MRINHLILIFSALLVFSCGKDSGEEIISQEDFLGEIGTPDFDSIKTDTSAFKGKMTPIGILALSLLPQYDTIPLTEFHMLDRYESSTSKKLAFKSKKTVPYGETTRVNPLAEIYYYTFSDSIKTKNVFYNWLDCFGSDCNAVTLNEDIDAVKTPPITTWVYDTTIVVVNYLCEHQENDWKSFEDSVVTHVGKNFNFNIKVDCGGPLKWK